jgi:hypothetical protein
VEAIYGVISCVIHVLGSSFINRIEVLANQLTLFPLSGYIQISNETLV